nr:LOW QUALITY PROTEIN: two pore calcium channel protein 1-like [Aotus nancymaae]
MESHSVVPFETSPQAIRLYYFYNHWTTQVATYFFICVDLALALFEEPALFPLPFLATSIAEILCLTAFFGRLIHFAKITPQMIFWKDTKNICIMVTIVVSVHCSTYKSGMENHETRFFSSRMPAYDFNWWYSLYFIIYIIINTYIFMSVFLAVVYNNYRKHLKNEICKLAYLKRHKMIAAFNILKVKVGTEFVVEEAQWRRLAQVVAPDMSSAHLELLLRISDEGQKGHVDKTNFLRLADLLNIQVVTINIKRHPLEAWVPRVYQSSASLLVQNMVRHRIFVWVFDVIILINAIFIALDEKNPLISYAEWLFLSLYIIEILLKLYTYEPRAYFERKQFWNWFDTLIIIAALVATVANATIQSAREYNSQQILDIVLILRILRLLRVIVSIQRFRVIVTTLINIGPAMLTFGGLVFVSTCSRCYPT